MFNIDFVWRCKRCWSGTEIIEAHAQILKGVREQVRDDFLILVNANDGKVPVHSEYVNGSFMEIGPWHQGGYSYKYLQAVENTLLWNEKNLRSPQINSLRPQGFGQYAPDAPENKRWMRLFTTMSLTHSDGYILYTTGRSGFFNGFDEKGDFIPHHEHIWYDFWNALLGRPIGGDESKGVLHKTSKGGTIDGLFIREFTNGWAVYNRSGQERWVYLPEKVSGWHSGVENRHWHVLPDLDGEIYLKRTTDRRDVNEDGIVNILDLVTVANGFGGNAPDVNGDGVVNVLDLVAVANAFKQ
ncbi:MAG: dockerin type I repeat-containing protein [Candidatus Poribacteria bacterium]|nr:dockerin type I repeat-containing protein [Candidatus Poribacteria bacterium]